MKQYESPNFSCIKFGGMNVLSDSNGLINYDEDWGKKDGFND